MAATLEFIPYCLAVYLVGKGTAAALQLLARGCRSLYQYVATAQGHHPPRPPKRPAAQ